jgi:hypothetical protein
MSHVIWEFINNMLSSPDYYSTHDYVTSRFREMENTAVELTYRIEDLARENDPYEALLISMLESRNEREMLGKYRNGS